MRTMSPLPSLTSAPRNMLAVIVEFRIKLAHVDAFEHAIVQNARASRETELGCRQLDVCRDLSDPQLFFLYELYDDEAAFQLHLKTPHFLHMNTTTADWIESKRAQHYARIAP
jgi:quinol monooxygenase YgiN